MSFKITDKEILKMEAAINKMYRKNMELDNRFKKSRDLCEDGKIENILYFGYNINNVISGMLMMLDVCNVEYIEKDCGIEINKLKRYEVTKEMLDTMKEMMLANINTQEGILKKYSFAEDDESFEYELEIVDMIDCGYGFALISKIFGYALMAEERKIEMIGQKEAKEIMKQYVLLLEEIHEIVLNRIIAYYGYKINARENRLEKINYELFIEHNKNNVAKLNGNEMRKVCLRCEEAEKKEKNAKAHFMNINKYDRKFWNEYVSLMFRNHKFFFLDNVYKE